MSMIGEIQVRNMFVANRYPTLDTVSGGSGQINTDETSLVKVLKDDGTNLDVLASQPSGLAVANNSELLIALRNHKGKMTLSDVINPKRVTYASSKSYAAPVQKIQTFSVIDAVANKLYSVRITIAGFGSLSVENEYIKEAFFKSKTGDDAEDIVDGLIASLNRNFSREQGSTPTTNTGFTFTKTGATTTAALVITEKNWIPEYYVTGKKDRLTMMWRANFSGGDTPATDTLTPGSDGIGTGYQVRNMEYYFLGNREDSFRQMGYPHNFDAVYNSILAGTYHILEIGYYDEGRDDAQIKSKKQFTLVIQDTADMNLLIAEVNKSLLATGIVIPVVA